MSFYQFRDRFEFDLLDEWGGNWVELVREFGSYDSFVRARWIEALES